MANAELEQKFNELNSLVSEFPTLKEIIIKVLEIIIWILSQK